MTAATRVRVQRHPVHGVLLLDKPVGISSNQALQKARWLLRAQKAGHTGTLDPLASGVLPLCFGSATKFSQLHLDADKTYETSIRLGIKTSTGDAEGETLDVLPVCCTTEQIVKTLKNFCGSIEQLPPMYSALKKDGKPLYAYARAGETVERQVRKVTIYEIELLDVRLDTTEPTLKLRVRCSKGTYIRTLGEDIAKALGCGGHLSALRRIDTGGLNVCHAITLEQLEALNESERLHSLLPAQALLKDWHKITLEPEQAGRFLSGVRLRGDWLTEEQNKKVAVFGCNPDALLGIAHICRGELIADRLLSPIEIQQTLSQNMQLSDAATFSPPSL